MNTPTRSAALLLALISITSPALAAAQTATPSPEGQRIINELLNGTRGSQDSEDMGDRAWRGSQSIYAQASFLAKEPVLSLPIPVLFNVELRNLTANFGDPRGDGTRTHEGLDIMAPRGTPIVSPTDAVVARIGNGASSGITVSTVNPGSERFVYMHLDSVAEGLREGQVVKPGDLLGYVGNTGNAAGGATHLHFEIRKDGALDPYPRLTKVFTTEERVAAAQKILGITTRTDAQQILANFARAIAPVVAPVSTPTTGTSATGVRDLKRGMTGEDVRTLQKYLNTHGFLVATAGSGSIGNETTYFGPATEAALISYQKSKSIVPAVGYYGPLTRASIATL